ncbi:ABC transporter permease [Sporosarcina newyorkensis]|uniref:ABC-2 type transport system permease protein n=2 Tax=Sporosarcina newyorkensis TaxID=759851 RepID=A0A1T4YY81_9BACL|nr:ABC transporter permease [Sporosarcina newyorkensis]EGQ24152.1 ATP binding cassette transporter permease protein [Sporosarcina newyorkensis 2681]SKB06613.1 ABC-2 type transport system permease protein [Sporosarcina newyorkensis]
MMISLRRMNAILQKDFKDFSRNLAVSTVLIMPIGLGAFYGRGGVNSIEAHYMLINLAFVMIATFVQCCLIAEEKEKNTLRGLMLSPASTTEILGGKSLLTFILTMITVSITAYLADYRPANIGVIALAFILSSFFYIAVGTLLGLFSKSVMEASVIVMPVVAVFSMGTFLPTFVDQYPFLKMGMYLPNIQLIELAVKVEAGGGFGDVLIELLIILAWTIILCMLTAAIYRKRMVD